MRPASTRSALRLACRDSPVSGATFASRSWPSMRRASAGMRSPSDTRSTSPGTRSPVATSVSTPPRRTVMRWGSMLRSACMARSARIACANVKSAFNTATATSAQPRAAMPCPGCMRSATKQSTAETSSSRLNRFANCLSRVRSQTPRGGALSTFGPISARRSATSSGRRPSGRLFKSDAHRSVRQPAAASPGATRTVRRPAARPRARPRRPRPRPRPAPAPATSVAFAEVADRPEVGLRQRRDSHEAAIMGTEQRAGPPRR